MDRSNPGSIAEDAVINELPTYDDVRSIGEIIKDTRNLTAGQVREILDYQQKGGLKFGEAAIALGYASHEDVLHALANQFNYAYGGIEREKTNPELVALNQPFGAQAEAFRAVRSQILDRVGKAVAEGVSGNRRAIAVVSPNTEDGKTFFSSNLAVVFAQLGGRTLIIDADLRGPRLHQVFGVESKTGLSGLLSGRKADGAIKAVSGIPNLFVLPVGVNPPNPLELLEGPAFGLLLHELLLKFDHIVVDTPAGQYGVDGAVVAARCGAAVIVARKDKGRITDLKGTVQTLQRAAVAIAGVVYNEE